MITVESGLTREELEQCGVFDWPVWEREVARFEWSYDAAESCYLLAGEVTVTPQGGSPVRIVAGDYVTFAAGLLCVWDIRVPVRKHYAFNVSR
jgi:uncharacterized cupin superfamily protein